MHRVRWGNAKTRVLTDLLKGFFLTVKVLVKSAKVQKFLDVIKYGKHFADSQLSENGMVNISN